MPSKRQIVVVAFAEGIDIAFSHLECESTNTMQTTPLLGPAKSTCFLLRGAFVEDQGIVSAPEGPSCAILQKIKFTGVLLDHSCSIQDSIPYDDIMILFDHKNPHGRDPEDPKLTKGTYDLKSLYSKFSFIPVTQPIKSLFRPLSQC
ncbi:hypothetical protein ACTXT7_012639 [Hymenolepis weldensis]